MIENGRATNAESVEDEDLLKEMNLMIDGNGTIERNGVERKKMSVVEDGIRRMKEVKNTKS